MVGLKNGWFEGSVSGGRCVIFFSLGLFSHFDVCLCFLGRGEKFKGLIWNI